MARLIAFRIARLWRFKKARAEGRAGRRESYSGREGRYMKKRRNGASLPKFWTRGVLYLGQKSRGEEKIKYLTMAYEKFGDCYYGNGVQVGPYARFLLGLYHRDMSKPEQAEKQFSDILRTAPDAIDHSGRSLKKVIETLPPATQPAL